jgi:hypothetical protein
VCARLLTENRGESLALQRGEDVNYTPPVQSMG